MKIIPYYLKVSLDHYSDTLLPFESFAECFGTIVATLPHSHPLFIFCFEKLAEKILELERHIPPHQPPQHDTLSADMETFEDAKLQQQIPQQPSQYVPSTVSSKSLAMFLFTHLVSVDIQVLDLLLEIIATVISAYDTSKRTVMCNYLYEIIARNFDYTRKNQCLNWYLGLVHQYGIRQQTN